MQLPEAIQRYFQANARLDRDAMLDAFSGEAAVRDENRVHRGTDEIRAWIEQTSIGLPAIATPVSSRSEGQRHIVEAQVSGSFPGSPVTLTFDFALEGGRICDLEIG